MSSKEGFKDDDIVCGTCLNVEYDPEHIEGGMMRDRWKCKLCGSEFKSKFCIESIQARLDRAEKENAELKEQLSNKDHLGYESMKVLGEENANLKAENERLEGEVENAKDLERVQTDLINKHYEVRCNYKDKINSLK